LHPPYSGAVVAVRATLDRASCWPRSRFSARGPGWPACLDHGQGNVEKHAVRNHGSTKHIDDAGTPAPARATRARLGIAAEWRFWQVFGRCELRAVRQRTKSPSPRCSDQVINRKPWKQTQRPSETSPPRSQFIAPASLRRICGWQRALSAHHPYSLHINYIAHFVSRERAQAVPGQNRSRNI